MVYRSGSKVVFIGAVVYSGVEKQNHITNCQIDIFRNALKKDFKILMRH